MGDRQIVYSSLATKKMLKSDLYMILRQARLNNEQSGVTGILIFSDGYFFQVLEGEEKIVSDLYKTISDDDRHSDIQLLLEEDLEKVLVLYLNLIETLTNNELLTLFPSKNYFLEI